MIISHAKPFISHPNLHVCCRCSVESSHRDDSNESLQYRACMRNIGYTVLKSQIYATSLEPWQILFHHYGSIKQCLKIKVNWFYHITYTVMYEMKVFTIFLTFMLVI